MNLTEKIEQLQNKPEAERKKMLIISLIIGMVLVTVIWTATLQNRLKAPAQENNAQKPWSLLWNNASDAFYSVKTGIITTWDSLKTGKTSDNAAPQESNLIYQKNQ